MCTSILYQVVHCKKMTILHGTTVVVIRTCDQDKKNFVFPYLYYTYLVLITMYPGNTTLITASANRYQANEVIVP